MKKIGALLLLCTSSLFCSQPSDDQSESPEPHLEITEATSAHDLYERIRQTAFTWINGRLEKQQFPRYKIDEVASSVYTGPEQFSTQQAIEIARRSLRDVFKENDMQDNLTALRHFSEQQDPRAATKFNHRLIALRQNVIDSLEDSFKHAIAELNGSSSQPISLTCHSSLSSQSQTEVPRCTITEAMQQMRASLNEQLVLWGEKHAMPTLNFNSNALRQTLVYEDSRKIDAAFAQNICVQEQQRLVTLLEEKFKEIQSTTLYAQREELIEYFNNLLAIAYSEICHRVGQTLVKSVEHHDVTAAAIAHTEKETPVKKRKHTRFR